MTDDDPRVDVLAGRLCVDVEGGREEASALLARLDALRDTSDRRDWHRVAIVTFMEVEGLDPRDAAGGAVIGMNQVLRPGTEVPFTHQNRSLGEGTLRIVDHMEVGMAAGNGYLWTEPTSRAFRNYRMPWHPPEQEEGE